MDKEKKSKTSKSRRETAVQGTNDSSIVSKCSMAALGYFNDPYLQSFVSKVTRRAPLIHRGYYIRAKTIDFILKQFLDSNPGSKQIISLGAGFDSAYFRLYSQDLLSNIIFFEVDFPEVVKRKHALIKSDPVLATMLGEVCSSTKEKSPHIELSAKIYKLLGVDLSQTNTLEAALNMCGVDFDKPTLLMSECVLTYMTRRMASGVVKWACETFFNSVFVLYEQINPSDAFGLFMQNHFHTVGSPLKCISYFPTITSQRERFQTLGWSRIESMDMNEFYNTLLSQSERDHVEKLEMFDEYEEWHLKCAHYMVLLGYHGNCKSLLKELQQQPVSEVEGIEESKGMIQLVYPVLEKSVKRFGHGSARLGTRLAVCVGGFGQQAGKHMRVTDVVLVDLVTMEIILIDPKIDNRVIEVSRMHGTVSCLKDGKLLLIGGRLSPMRLCTQLVVMEIKHEKLLEWKFSNEACVSDKPMNCGFKNVLKKDNLSDKIIAGDGNKPVSDDAIDKLSMNCSKMNISDVILCDKSAQNSGDKVVDGVVDQQPDKVKDEESVMGIKCDLSKAPPLTGVNAINGQIDGDGLGPNVNEPGRQANGGELHCSVIEQHGDVPSPRWRHSVVVHTDKVSGNEEVYMYGGRSQHVLAFSDCFKFTVRTGLWSKVEGAGTAPESRQSHTACIWNTHMVIAGGLSSSLQPLSSVYMLDLDTCTWSQISCDISPRYSHTAHMFGDILVLIGGVNLSHSTPGVAMVHLPSGTSAEFALPEISKDNLVMLHRHSSVAMDNSKVLILGGGGNCFSFGTHLNSSPIIMDLTQALDNMNNKVSERT